MELVVHTFVELAVVENFRFTIRSLLLFCRIFKAYVFLHFCWQYCPFIISVVVVVCVHCL